MKKIVLAAASLIAMSAAAIAPAANAAPYGHGDFNVNGHRYERMAGPAWQAPRGWHGQRFHRGQRLPDDYRRAEVNNWRAYHLHAPPRGYHYVRVGNDVVLAAVATGLISAVIANAFYN